MYFMFLLLVLVWWPQNKDFWAAAFLSDDGFICQMTSGLAPGHERVIE
jgi:hypothetical protein